jgi:hypothetical protein
MLTKDEHTKLKLGGTPLTIWKNHQVPTSRMNSLTNFLLPTRGDGLNIRKNILNLEILQERLHTQL